MAKYALVIGISDYSGKPYQDSELHYSFLRTLPTPTNDAEEVAKILETHGKFRVTRCPYKRNEVSDRQEMRSRKVNKSEVIAEIRQFLSDAKKHEALIYFIGHGIEDSTDLGSPKGLLAASDFKVKRDNSEKVVGYENGISFQALNEEFKNADLSNLVVILDCCHSGHLIEDINFIDRKLLESRFDAFSVSRDYFLIASCRSSQESIIVKGKPRGVFTDALVKALSQENANMDGNITCNLLLDTIDRKLRENNENQEVVYYGGGRLVQLLQYTPSPLKISDNKNSQEVILQRDNPYLGLKSFEEEQAGLFYGRSKAVRELVDILNSSRFVAVIGASGCGKSSLVRAGLLPEFGKYFPGRSSWQQEILIPGDEPVYNLGQVLKLHTDNQPWLLFIDQFEEIFTLTQEEEERKRFIDLVVEEATNADKQTYVIIAVRGDFLDRCANYPKAGKLINQQQKTYYVVQPLSTSELEEAIAKPANGHGVRFEPGLVSQIISDVNQQSGALPLLQYTLQKLWAVWLQDKSNENPQLTFNGYEQIGGLKGALNIEATQIYESLTSEDDKNFVQKLFTMELVQLGEGEGQEVTRKRVMREGLNELRASERKWAIIRRFAKARLIVSDNEKIEVAHEALFTEWLLLKEWIKESRDDIRLRQKLDSRYREWKEDYNESPDQLLTGKLLSDIKERKEKIGNISSEEEDFIQKSSERRKQEEQKEIDVAKREVEQEKQLKEEAQQRFRAENKKLKTEKRAKTTLIIFIVIIFILSLSSFMFYHNQQSANQQKKDEELFSLGILVNKAENSYDINDQLGALLASIQALDKLEKMDLDNKSQSFQAFNKIKNIVYKIQERRRIDSLSEEVSAVSISSDGKLIISAGNNGRLRLWDVKEEEPLSSISGHEQAAWSVRFSHSKEKKEYLIASTGFDYKVKLWTINKDDKSLESIASLDNHTDNVYDASFNSSQTRIASSSKDGTIRIWDISDLKLIKKISDLEVKKNILEVETQKDIGSGMYSLDFHPTKNFIAFSGYKEGGLYFANLEQKNDSIKIINKHKAIVGIVRFSSDGRYLASASFDGMVKIWDANNIRENSEPLAEINAHNDKQNIYGLAFSQDSKYLASSSRDKTIKIWDLNTTLEKYKINKQPLKQSDYFQILQGHDNEVRRIEFNPVFSVDSNADFMPMIVSGSNDKTIRLWNWKNELDSQKQSDIKSLLTESCKKVEGYSSKQKSSINNICN